jgi:hypothetical protein
MIGTVRTLARTIDYAGRSHPSGQNVTVMSEPASGGYFYVQSRIGVSVYILSLRESDLLPVKSDSAQEPTAEILLYRSDKLFNRAYNAYVDYRNMGSLASPIAVHVYLAYQDAWQIMTGLTADQVDRRMQETYQGRDGALIVE